ncbi:MAG TPA: polysaccharide deacetylase family protein [Daejeonella sp.]|nr:polysaccharide deacetylase family protein [Daejeonella sp.]
MKSGKFIISLDFELIWGVRDKKSIEQYGKNIRGVHQVIPRLLKSFRNHQVKATFATVGFLFFENKQQLLNHLPSPLPNYIDKNLSPYLGYLNTIGEDAQTDPYHFAPQLIKLIQKYPEHEIGSHTFSHYYCLEKGQNRDEFDADIQNAQKVAAKYSISLTSLIFPRNQFNGQYLRICQENGIICYRGYEHSWLYKVRNGKDNSIRRALRLMDAYVNISGHNCYSDNYLKSKTPIDIPASRFLRPYSGKLKMLDGLRLKRIKSGMSYAAKNNLTYHLWWHPHNFGINMKENFSFLEKLLNHYNELNATYNFQSYTMTELATKIKDEQQKNTAIRRTGYIHEDSIQFTE